MSKQQPEYHLQCQVCEYLRWQFKDVLFDSDTIASARLSIPQANRNKKIQKEGFKRPDLVIYQPNKHYHGLFIELKVESPFKKDGTIKKNEHLEGQYKTLQDLESKGYKAVFAWTFEQAKQIIDEYLKK